jgi:biopolymer transport protein ExbB
VTPEIDTTPIPRPVLPPGSATLASATPADPWGAWAYSAVVQPRSSGNAARILVSMRGHWAFIRLSAGNFDFSQARRNGRDLRFLNPDGTPLKYSISYWSRWRHKAVIWVRLPAERPEYLIMLWGNPSTVGLSR